MSTLVIDAETYLFRAAMGSEYEIEWQRDQWTYVCDHAKARDSFARSIEHLQAAAPARCKSVVLCYGGRSNFRYGVLRSYKGNRRNQRRPAGYRRLINWACSTWDFQALPDVEGDDVTGLTASYRDGDVIASIDKDLRTVPGYHLIEGKVKEVTLWEADLAFYRQVLTGDRVDGYTGCPGIGPAKAEKILSFCTSEPAMWEAVVLAFMEQGLTEEDALAQARCARILRAGEYDMDRCLPCLWSPPVACA